MKNIDKVKVTIEYAKKKDNCLEVEMFCHCKGYDRPFILRIKHFKAFNMPDENALYGMDNEQTVYIGNILKSKNMKKAADTFDYVDDGVPWEDMLKRAQNAFFEYERKYRPWDKIKYPEKIDIDEILDKEEIIVVNPNQDRFGEMFFYGFCLKDVDMQVPFILTSSRKFKSLNGNTIEVDNGFKKVKLVFKDLPMARNNRISRIGIKHYITGTEGALETSYNLPIRELVQSDNTLPTVRGYNTSSKSPRAVNIESTYTKRDILINGSVKYSTLDSRNVENNSTSSQKRHNLTLFDDISGQIEKHISFGSDDESKLITLWVMGTYIYKTFHTYPYLYLTGYRETGKTKVLTISRLMSFNGISAGDITAPALFRMMEHYSPSFFIDEVEDLAMSPGRMSDKAKDVRSILLNAYKRGGRIIRVNKEDLNKIEEFDVFSPIMFANIRGLEETILSRAIEIVMRRAKKKDPRGNVEVNEYSHVWQQLRDRLYCFGLSNAIKIMSLYNNSKAEEGISNRDWELWKPLFSIAKYVDKDVYNSMVKFAKKKVKEREVQTFNEEMEPLVLRAMVDIIAQYKREEFYSYDLIIDKMIERMDIQKDKDGNKKRPKWVTGRWLSYRLKRFDMNEKQRRRDGTYVKIEQENLIDSIERYGDSEWVEEVKESFKPEKTDKLEVEEV